ncbi:MAG: hypothetical protein ACKPKO_52290, partial [Candidatus Fonsibacter sp.]
MDEVNYIMEFRPEKELHIYIHDEAPKTTTTVKLQTPRGYNNIITKKSWEQDTDLMRRCEKCDNPWLGEEWTSAVATTSKACREVRTRHHDEIVRTTGYLEGGSGQRHARTVCAIHHYKRELA